MKVTGHIREKSTKKGKAYQIVVEFPIDRVTGKRNRKYFTIHDTKKRAQQKLNDLIYEYSHGTHVEPSKHTVNTFMKEFMSTYVIPHTSPTTYESYQKIIDRYIKPILGHMPLEDLNPIMIQKWVNSLSNGDYINSNGALKPQTVKNIFLRLSSAMDKAVELKLITESPCKYTQLPKLVKYNATVFDDAELKKFLNAIKGHELETPMMILLMLGLRRGEAIALRWKCIDWDNKTINITESMVQTSKDTNYIKAPKSKAGIRSIVMPKHLYEYLKAEYDTLKRLDKHFSEDDFIIHKKGSKEPYKPNTLYQKFKRFLKQNNLEDIRLHDLRHTTATIMLNSGISPKISSQVLGHSTVSVTLDTYSHVLKSVQVDAADKIDKQIFGE